MTPYELQNCSDFSSAILNQAESNRQIAFNEACARGMDTLSANRFAQGYVHTMQGRTDLHGVGGAYDDGAEFAILELLG